MSSESKISQVYDVYGDEIACVEHVYNVISDIANLHGFFKLQTAPFEERDRYLGATKVHYSKIFEVVRPKQRSTFLLKSDLAMSMSRFVADMNDPGAMTYKFIQMDDLYRDRIPNLPGYRKNFKQILLGIWGTKMLYADAELISMCLEMMNKIQCFDKMYLQISNQGLFNVLGEDVAGKVRFGDIDFVKSLLQCENDFALLKELYSKPNISMDELYELRDKFEDHRIVAEIESSLELYKMLVNLFNVRVPIRFSLSNLGGTNHYSGMNYRIYATTKDGDEYLLIDGGRIDNLVGCFNNSVNVPGVCMGIGIQVMAQLMQGKTTKKKRVYFVVEERDSSDEKQRKVELANQMNRSSLSSWYTFSVLPCKKFNIKAFFASEFYKTSVVIFYNKQGLNVRSNTLRDEAVIKQVLEC